MKTIYRSDKKVMITLSSVHSSVMPDEPQELTVRQDDDGEAFDEEKFEMTTEGRLRLCDSRVELEYFETELTGMDGSCTCISFEQDEPGLVTMLRTGSVETALVFEEGCRHVCTYNADPMAFEVTVSTERVENRLTLDGGSLELLYGIEFRGSVTEMTHITLSVRTLEG